MITNKRIFQTNYHNAGNDHIRPKEKHPWTNGKAGAMVPTVQEQTITGSISRDISEQIADNKNSQDYHNTKRKLNHLKNITNCDTNNTWYQLKPGLLTNQPSAYLTTTW